MLHDIFVNICILMVLIFLTAKAFMGKGITPSSPIKQRLLFGFIAGVSTCIMMVFTIHIKSNVTLDFRYFCIIIVSFFGGIVPSVVAGIISIIFNLAYHGINDISIVSAIGTILVSLGCGIFSSFNINDRLKWILMFIYSILIRRAVFSVILSGNKEASNDENLINLATIIVSVALYFFINYLIESHKRVTELYKKSIYDYLTGVYNKGEFELRYKNIIENVDNLDESISLITIDIDHFKSINDTYGHDSGDFVLREISKVLKKSFREDDFIARVGGEEFSIILRGLSAEKTKEIAERLRIAVENHWFILPCGKNVSITISIGIAVYAETTNDINYLKEISDQKLYIAKQSGRNMVCS
ncbi:GGDEF domain-containing protein [Clostridium cylindrosporum]|uniref:Diguanylate cyclase n=1 Tax=Clostridium cylindrosporum DSM 605 TaxID=1121307 RepID=A0A0J8D7U3_CLOCY|nr:GGDEF domain-containing protein [Clostridium cylindrosporum]KMT21952.1 diguanylate cyclase [Clostridium cylindrosporum DSM 605]